MNRIISVVGLLVGWTAFFTDATSLPAQQFRNLPQTKVVQPPAVQNNFNNQLFQPGQKIVSFNVVGSSAQGNLAPNASLPNTPALISALNNGTLNTNPINNGFQPTFNPYATNAALNPVYYNTMMYGNPYGMPYGYPINPYYSYFNPYAFLGTGAVAGMSGGPIGGGVAYPSPGQMYNFNLNYQYLSNPYLNPLSNPAFSGPFPPGLFNSTAALSLLGFGNVLQNLPLNPNGQGLTGGANPFP
jgi:hypothetical protein